VIVLHHLAGLPVEDVARELRLAPGTVKSRLARGRAAMAGSLDHDRSEVTS
jgi:RNA polymerase sigma-70 factor (ECF subfamily)